MSRTQDEIAGAGAGAATGAAVGSVAGPEGALVGGLLGALFGALMGDLAHVTPETAKSAPSPIANRDDPMDASDDPFCTPDTVMGGVPHKRPINPIETPKPKRVYEEVDNKHEKFPSNALRLVLHTGPRYTAGWCRDFSAIQRTRLNPVTGRIIGYKGIPRKRGLSTLSKYSEFWRAQKHAKTSFHAARSPGVWDSARR